MKEDKVYPAIYRDSGKAIYLYSNADNYYCYSREMWDQTSGEDGHENDKNITHEYLANTYGEVVSPEHAEFIIELGKNTNAKASTEYSKGSFFNFYTDLNGELYLDFFDRHLASDSGEKKITIPLPPELKDDDSLKENGDNLIFGDADKCKEWPCVGDEVQTSFGKGVIKLLPDMKGCYVILIEGIYFQLKLDEIKKPKTPEEELRDEIADDLNKMQLVDSRFKASELMAKYSITKKPQ